MNHARPIPFTQVHNDLIHQTFKKLGEHDKAIEKNSKAIIRNREAIDRNSKLIERNHKEIKVNRLAIEKNYREIHRLGIMMEDQRAALQAILEIVDHIDKRFRKLDDLENK